MFARVFKSTVMVSVVAFLAVARGVPTSTSNSECNNGGQIQCCQQTFSPTGSQGAGLAGLLGLNLGGILGDVGLICDPIDVLGIGSGVSCQQQAVCCTNVNQNGLINLGCSPINLNM